MAGQWTGLHESRQQYYLSDPEWRDGAVRDAQAVLGLRLKDIFRDGRTYQVLWHEFHRIIPLRPWEADHLRQTGEVICYALVVLAKREEAEVGEYVADGDRMRFEHGGAARFNRQVVVMGDRSLYVWERNR